MTELIGGSDGFMTGRSDGSVIGLFDRSGASEPPSLIAAPAILEVSPSAALAAAAALPYHKSLVKFQNEINMGRDIHTRTSLSGFALIHFLAALGSVR